MWQFLARIGAEIKEDAIPGNGVSSQAQTEKSLADLLYKQQKG
jgi:hypothetical protein